jgi:hypothetical protein
MPFSCSITENIVAIKLPSSADAKKGKTYAGEEVFLSGWGKTNDSM